MEEFFDILKTLSAADKENNTKSVRLGNIFISAKQTNHGSEITMGADLSSMIGLCKGEKTAAILIIDKKAYDAIKEEKDGKNK